MTDAEMKAASALAAACGGNLLPGLRLRPDSPDEKLIFLAARYQVAAAKVRNHRRGSRRDGGEAAAERAAALADGARWAFRVLQAIPPRTVVGHLVKLLAARSQARDGRGTDTALTPQDEVLDVMIRDAMALAVLDCTP